MKVVVVLSALFWVAVAWSAVHPLLASDYWIEIVTPVGGWVILAVLWRWFKFTPLAYVLFFLEMIVLTVGAHYTHERVPLFDAIKPWFGFQRNHYDRFAHFCVGLLLVIPAREILRRATPLRGKQAGVIAVLSILALAALYEISEWWIAVLASPEAGIAYLGSQGDPWDAQKDMLADGLGAIAGILALSVPHERALDVIGCSNTSEKIP